MKRKELVMGGSVVLLVVAISLAVLTHVQKDSHHPFMMLLIHNHVLIMLVLVFVAMAFGYFWANALHGEDQREKRSEDTLSLLEKLINKDEQLILRLLVENDGKISQNEISKHEKMTRVKAHRTVKMLQDRDVVKTEKHGKRVYVYLESDILQRMI